MTSQSRMRRWVLIVIFSSVGVALFALGTGVAALHLAPKACLTRMPTALLLWVRPLSDATGRSIIADRLRQNSAESTVLAALHAGLRTQRAMAEALIGGNPTLRHKVAERLKVLALHADIPLRMAARSNFSSVDLALGWSAVAATPSVVGTVERPLGADAWVPRRKATMGLIALSYLGAGYDHRMPSKYKLRVAGLIQALAADQDDNGRLADDDRDHAIATCALAEAYAMSNDPSLRSVVNSAIEHLLRDDDRGPEGRWSANSALAVWDTMAMKSASVGGVKHGLIRMQDWSSHFSDFGRRCFRDGNEVSVHAKDLNAMRGVIGIFLGDTAATLGLTASDLTPDPQLSPLTNYWLTLTHFQIANIERLHAYRNTIILSQLWDADPLRHGCYAADLDPAAHAVFCLIMEVWYRYLPVGVPP